MQPGSSSADQPEINWWPSIMWRNNLSRKGGSHLLPFMHRAGLSGGQRLFRWTVFLCLWPLSIPVYHFPQCLCWFGRPLSCSQGLQQKVILSVCPRTLVQFTIAHLAHLQADGESEDHSPSASYSPVVLDLALEWGSWTSQVTQPAGGCSCSPDQPKPEHGAVVHPGRGDTAQQKAATSLLPWEHTSGTQTSHRCNPFMLLPRLLTLPSSVHQEVDENDMMLHKWHQFTQPSLQRGGMWEGWALLIALWVLTKGISRQSTLLHFNYGDFIPLPCKIRE